MGEQGSGGAPTERLRVLVVRSSFANLGGAERELLTVLREWGQRWEVRVATLALTPAAEKLSKGLDVTWVKPDSPVELPTGALAEMSGKASRVAEKSWGDLKEKGGLSEAIEWADVAHISVCRGSLEILPHLPDGIGIHYHCLEPPRWLYEDVLHRKVDGKAKRPMWLTNLLFRRQRRRDRSLVKRLLQRPGAAISGNSHHVQANLGNFYNLPVNPSLSNGEPTQRDPEGRAMGPTVLMHVVDLSDWPSEADSAEQNAVLEPDPNGPYVVTVGRIGWVKGTWETLHSLKGTGLGLAQVGGGEPADKAKLAAEAKRVGVPLWLMPRLDQAALRKLVRGSLAMVSHAHAEPFGLTPIEAMAVGIPALFVDDGGFHWTMHDAESGRLLPRPILGGGDDDQAMLAWRAAYAEAQDSDVRAVWAATGRPHVEGKFTLDVQATALERLLQDCMKHA